jgi:hypothetical protein
MKHRTEAYVSVLPGVLADGGGRDPLHRRFLERQLARDDVVGFRAVCLRRSSIASPALSAGRTNRQVQLRSDLQQHQIYGCWYDDSPDAATLGHSPSFDKTLNGDSAGGHVDPRSARVRTRLQFGAFSGARAC